MVIGGEQQEADGGFDDAEYAADAASLGMAKGLIMLGHVISEQPGMEDLGNGCRPSSRTSPLSSFLPKSRSGHNCPFRSLFPSRFHGSNHYRLSGPQPTSTPPDTATQDTRYLCGILSKAQVSASHLMSFPQIDWSQGRAAVGSFCLRVFPVAHSCPGWRRSCLSAVALRRCLAPPWCCRHSHLIARSKVLADKQATGVPGIEVIGRWTLRECRRSKMAWRSCRWPASSTEATATAQACSDLCRRNAACKAATFEKMKRRRRSCWRRTCRR